MPKGVPQAGDEFAPKDMSEHRDRQKEAWPRVDPLGAIRRQAARWHDAVDVGMVLQPLAPGMEDHQPADVATEALRIARDLAHSLGGGVKEQVVHHALVDERETGERLRHREDDVDIADREQLLLASGHPCVPRRGQTLGAMAIATAVAEGRLRALVTAIAMSAERGGAALRDGPEHAPMLSGYPGAVPLHETIAMSAHNVGHLERWRRHRRCFNRVRRALSGSEIVSASSGFATACRCFCERWEIEHRVPDLHVTEEQLNRPEVRATLEQVRGV